MLRYMSRGKNMIRSKLKSGRSKEECGGGSYLKDKANVNEEYKEAFRTKSYKETWTRVHGQLEKASFDTPSSSSPTFNHHMNLSRYLVQPKQETLDKIGSLNFHHLLLDYFQAGLEGSNFCESLLRSIHQTRVHYRKITRVIMVSKRIQDINDEQCSVIHEELAGFALLKNPFAIFSPGLFRVIHEANQDLFHKLTSAREKLKRQAKFRRISKKIGSLCLVISHTTFIIALLMLAFHSLIGMIAAPGLAACFFGTRKMKKSRSSRNHQQELKTSLLERLGAQLDISAKGIYILINDFDTISRLVWRMQDEIEHRKAIADKCTKNGKVEVLKEVIRELRLHDSIFMEQLNELEENTILCFHTINRSRKLVLEEIADAQALY
ncbi:hypothetical protein V6N12_071053 [Hibiscus sabdariffa]|uniref:Uncharacterized protein n=1 Tax=Hibiscus sabdariffa TaxID=183260 RepID=A0ABR2FIW2_9ROSI